MVDGSGLQRLQGVVGSAAGQAGRWMICTPGCSRGSRSLPGRWRRAIFVCSSGLFYICCLTFCMLSTSIHLHEFMLIMGFNLFGVCIVCCRSLSGASKLGHKLSELSEGTCVCSEQGAWRLR
ncbi:hypothetical protein PR202_gb07913 [Eleusine coracana subsp. coracana]|uniref:Uncharacterized protein n=1 Tax=Eleusine coracana subsp. coracana TaxID=191504 RepID=A0AAV5EDF5_ELECO|nr:hypothetical protein PR202_gb07913 [Eleusine coracana subsp. coracana]